MKKNMIKATLLASAIVCTILTSCNKEEGSDIPVIKATNSKPARSFSTLSEDRPKRAKGKVKSSAMVDIPSAQIFLGRSIDSLILDTFTSDSYGDFESNFTFNPASYYVLVRATGYQDKYVSFMIPSGEGTELDLGVIILEAASPSPAQ